MNKTKLNLKIFLLSNRFALIFLIAFIFLLTSVLFIFKYQSHHLKDHYKNIARVAAGSISSNRLDLFLTMPENSSPHYKQLKTQLINLKKSIIDCRYIYILGKNSSDSLVFLINGRSFLEEKKMPSKIGEIYAAADENYYTAFSGNKIHIFGPVKDQYGHTISILFPLQTIQEKTVLAIDIAVHDWYKKILRFSILPIFFILLIISGIIAYIIFKQNFLFIVNREKMDKIRQEKIQSATMESIGEGLITTNIKGKVTKINTYGKKILNLTDNQIYNKYLQELFPLKNHQNFFFDIIYNQKQHVKIDNALLETTSEEMIVSVAASQIIYKDILIGTIIVFRDITEQTKIKKQLEENQKKLKVIIQNSPVFIFILDLNKIITFVEGNILNKIGVSKEQIINRPITDFISEENRLSEYFEKTIQGEENGFIYNFRDFYFKISLSPMINDNNKITSVLCFGFDITDTKRMENSLRQSEETFRALAENSQDVIMRFNKFHEHLYVNPAVEKLTGLPYYDFFGKTHEELGFSEELCQLWGKHINRVFETEKVNRIEFKMPNGQWIDWLLMPEIDENNQVKAVITSARDITRMKKNEAQLQYLQSYLKDIIDSMPSIIIGVNDNGNINLWNKKIAEKTGLSDEEVINKNIKSILPDNIIRLNLIKEALEHNEEKEILKHAIKTENGTVYKNILVYPLKLPDTKQVIIRIDDVSKQVQLEKMVIQSEKMHSLGGLAAGMAHEINNPIAGMIQNCDLLINRLTKKLPKNVTVAKKYNLNFNDLLDYLTERKIIKTLKFIHQSGEQAAKIVESMLDFANQGTVQKAMHNFIEIIDSSIHLILSDYDLKNKYDFKHIKLIKNYPSLNYPVYCDRSQIQQVILNILKNGAEAMSNYSQGDQSIFTISLSQDTNFHILSIADNGPGIEADDHPYIFDPFFTTKSPDKGSGLGLSISYFIIVENHNGEMLIDKTYDKGCKFIIKLPNKAGVS